MPEPSHNLETPAKPSIARRAIGFAVGILLLAAALWAVFTSHDALAALRSGLTESSWSLRILAIALPIINWILISISFWLLTRRFGNVALLEMHALIGSAWLLNYLPLRPGMIGRMAYHKTIHNIRVTDSIRIMVISVALTAIATAVLLGLSILAIPLHTPFAWSLLALPAFLLLALGIILALRARSIFDPRAALILAFAVRFLDILTWVARYAVVFTLIGHPISIAQAALITAVSQLAMTIPLAGNGLGLREWGIGLTLPIAAANTARSVGLSADLLNRAAELLIALPVGLLSAALLAHRYRKHRTKPTLQSHPDPADASMRTDS